MCPSPPSSPPPPPTAPSTSLFGPGTYLNVQTGQCEVECTSANSGRRLAELLTANNDTPPSTAHEVVSGFVAAHPKFAAKLSSGLDEEMVTYLEKLSEQLFGQPVSFVRNTLPPSLARRPFSLPRPHPSPLLTTQALA